MDCDKQRSATHGKADKVFTKEYYLRAEVVLKTPERKMEIVAGKQEASEDYGAQTLQALTKCIPSLWYRPKISILHFD